MREGIIVRGRGGFYTVRQQDGEEFVLRAKKKFRRQGMSPLVGDRILFTPGTVGEEDGWIEEILPRKSQCLRPPVANVTLLCIVAAPRPAPDWLLVDKLLIFARKQGLRPLLIINKSDIEPAGETASLARCVYADAETEVLSVSAREKTGLEELRQLLSGEICCFSGQSGVGKSTILNALFGLSQETGTSAEKSSGGKTPPVTQNCLPSGTSR